MVIRISLAFGAAVGHPGQMPSGLKSRISKKEALQLADELIRRDLLLALRERGEMSWARLVEQLPTVRDRESARQILVVLGLLRESVGRELSNLVRIVESAVYVAPTRIYADVLVLLERARRRPL